MIINTLHKFSLFFLFASLLVSTGFAQEEDSAIFSTPEILKHNVAFWKKIYTEVSLKEGLYHDRDFPQVVFKKVRLEQTSGFGYHRNVDGQKNHIASCLRNVENMPESTWNEEEKAYAVMYTEQAPAGALSGAAGRIRFQLGQKERFRQGVEKSMAYIDTIRTIFKAYKVPQRLAYLPHVESSFNLESYSKVGAAGIWQFMRSTGRLFLHINYLIDERRDPILATVAAARLLTSNYRDLGAWPLAITAYNHGVNGMKRAINQTGSRDIEVVIKNYTSPSFQFSSKNFYACFLAASDVAIHATDYFPDLNGHKRIEFKNVKLPSYMRPSVISNYLHVPPDMLREFNPAIRPVVFSQQKQLPSGYEIRIPKDMAMGSTEQMLAAIPDSLKSSVPERSEYYTVQLGDNLFGIATRFGVSLEQLLMENSISRKNKIFEGQVLRIPQTGKAVVAVAQAPAPTPETLETPGAQQAIGTEQEELPLLPAQRKIREVEKPKKQAPPLVSVEEKSKTQPPEQVTAAETTEAAPPVIAWETSPKDSEKALMKPDLPEYPEQPVIPAVSASVPKESKLSLKARAAQFIAKKPVQQVVMPAAMPKTAPLAPAPIADSLKEIAMTAAVSAPEASATSKPSVFPKFDVDIYNLEVTLSPDGSTAEIRVSTDETIGHYAEWLGIATYRIRQINRMGGRSDIRIGGPISIPADQPGLATMVKTRLEYHMAIEEDFYGRFKVTDVRKKTIRSGEALWDICNGPDQIPLWLLKKYNKQVDLGRLMPGATIWIPVVEEKSEREIAGEASGIVGKYPAFQPPHEAATSRGIYLMP